MKRRRKEWLLLIMVLAEISCLAQQRWISHLSKTSGGFKPGLVIANQDRTLAHAIRLQPYLAAGEVLTPVEMTIEPGATTYVSAVEFFGRDDVSHFTIDSDDAILVTTTYTAITGQGTPVHVHESTATSLAWRFYPGDWQAVWDGLAMVKEEELTSFVQEAGFIDVPIKVGLGSGLSLFIRRFHTSQK